MHRSTVIQRLLDLYEAPRYLEIGVDQGVTFHELRAASKVGVDPKFAFDVHAARVHPANASARYYEVTSDAFFTNSDAVNEEFDVIFIDGLHTFDQTLRDLLHATYVLAEGGVIIVDDVLPNTYAASLPDLELSRQFWHATSNPDGSWMGDVYRLVFFIEDYLTSFSYATVFENHGQTVLWRAPRNAVRAAKTVETISRLTYVDAIMGRASYHAMPFEEIIVALKQRGGTSDAL